MKKLIISGTSGFVGGNLQALLAEFFAIETVSVSEMSKQSFSVEKFIESKGWSKKDYVAFLHVGGYAHRKFEDSQSKLEEDVFNFCTSLADYLQVSTFIYLVSEDIFCPNGMTKYASKLKNTKTLLNKHNNFSFESVVIKSPLIYGPNPKGNFKMLFKTIEQGKWLPFGLLNGNERYYLSIYNLADFIAKILDGDLPHQDVFHINDSNKVSFKHLSIAIGNSQGKKAALLPVPLMFLKLALLLVGKKEVINKISNSSALRLDNELPKGWSAPFTLEESLHKIFNK